MQANVLFLVALAASSIRMIILFPKVKLKDCLFAGLLSALIAIVMTTSDLSFPFRCVLTLCDTIALAILTPIVFHVISKYTDFFEIVLIGRKHEEAQ